MDKKQTKITGNVILPLCVGESAAIVYGDKVISTSSVAAVHKISSDSVVIETMNTIYTVESLNSDVCISFNPVKKRKKFFFGIFKK